MATIKSYTDIEQSRKLVEILPLESADMEYLTIKENGASVGSVPFIKDDSEVENSAYNYVYDRIACWSLASLLEEIPEVICFDDDESDYTLEILKEGGFYYLSYGNSLEHGKIEIEPQENFVDACVAMIEKLHELKML